VNGFWPKLMDRLAGFFSKPRVQLCWWPRIGPGDEGIPSEDQRCAAVASVSEQHTIREFAHKNHYNDWQFYYDLGYNRGFAINGPTVKVALPSVILRPGETPDAGQAQTPNLNCNLDR
jgi:hypothetical protein